MANTATANRQVVKAIIDHRKHHQHHRRDIRAHPITQIKRLTATVIIVQVVISQKKTVPTIRLFMTWEAKLMTMTTMLKLNAV